MNLRISVDTVQLFVIRFIHSELEFVRKVTDFGDGHELIPVFRKYLRRKAWLRPVKMPVLQQRHRSFFAIAGEKLK